MTHQYKEHKVYLDDLTKLELEVIENRGDLKLLEFETPSLPEGTEFCEYISKCNKTCFQNTNKYDNCRVRKFYDKHGENY